MWSFDRPLALLLLLIIPLALWLMHGWKRRGGTVPISFALWKGAVFKAPKTGRNALSIAANLLLWISVTCFVFALAEPVRLVREKVFTGQGADIMLALDVSPSMAAQDMPGTSRLEQAKNFLNTFIARRSNDAIGVVAFGSEAVLVCPPTLDHQTLLERINSLKPNVFGDGTSIGLGLSLAALHLDRGGAKGRIVILLSDGDNTAGEITPEAATGMLKTMGARVYTLGLGSNRDVYIEYEDEKTGTRYQGTYHGVLDEKMLTTIAIATNGKYFATSDADSLSGAFDYIDGTEQSDAAVRFEIQRESLYAIFLGCGFFLFCAELLIRRLFLREVA